MARTGNPHNGAVAIVTGGGSGIGAGIVRALVRRGADVVVADIDGEAAQRVVDDLGEPPTGSAVAATVDVTDPDAVRDLVTSTAQRHGRLDLLFNNAGLSGAAEPEEVSLDAWERTLDVNLRGVIHGCHAAYPIMVAQGSGHIVNTASLAGLIGGLGGALPYTTTKHAVVGLSTGLRVAGAAHGVRVSVLCPGGVETPIWDKNDYTGPDGPTARTLMEGMPAPAFLTPDDLAADVLRGVDRNRAFIVAPRSARIAWRMYRLSPTMMLAGAKLGTARIRKAQR